MNPRELHELFSAKEQTLLVTTEAKRLAGLSEDELDDLLTRVRRARNKYTKLYRRQSAALVDASSSRAGTKTSNQRTKRKAEILEDALARVARALSAAARATAKELKQERLQAASEVKGSAPASSKARPSSHKLGRAPARPGQRAPGRSGATGARYDKSRQASTKATGARRQGRRDSR